MAGECLAYVVHFALLGNPTAVASSLISMMRSLLSLRTREYVQAAVVTGQTNWWIIWREILPNALSPVIVLASLMVATAILLIVAYLAGRPAWLTRLTSRSSTLSRHRRMAP